MSTGNYEVIIPENMPHGLKQNEEYFILKKNNGAEKTKIGFHEYGKIYSIPGLYEQLFYEKLKCASPKTVCKYLKEIVEENNSSMSDLCVLDLGAGNGMVGEELYNAGVEDIYGIDIEVNAKKAVERDRPDIYKKYYIEDLTRVSAPFRKELEEKSFNCMTAVDALGFGHIPPNAFTEAFNLLSTPARVAFNIKEDFLSDRDRTGFSNLIKKMIKEKRLEIHVKEHYCHRLSMQGKPLHYIAIVGKKVADIPGEWVF
ncbi:MAG: class I SAM-dependent methyltransferase [Candidatus Mariimomonas ferrooxydans]